MASLNLKFGDTGEALLAKAKQFKTGSVGYGAYGKVVIDGERYQVSCSMVKIGSKPVEGETRSASGAILGEPTADADQE